MVNVPKQILIDHHAHLLREDFLELDSIGLRQAFSESRSLLQLQHHSCSSLSYLDFIGRLSQFLDVKGEKSIIELRERLSKANYVNMLFDDCSIGALIIDDGFVSTSAMSLNKFAALCERPVFRCRRIETALEEALVQSGTFERLEQIFPKVLLSASDFKIVALKTIAAYRGGLEIAFRTREQALADFDRTKSGLSASGKPRITRGDLYHYFLLESFAIAQTEKFPVQIHCGLGDQDQDLREANPLVFRNILETARFNRTNFVFLHCYPYVREAAYLASLYSNVFIDISLVSFVASYAVTGCFVDALAVAPASKILASTDGHSVPETYWYSANTIKRGLGHALQQMIDAGFLEAPTAERVAGMILHENAIGLYQLEGLK